MQLNTQDTSEKPELNDLTFLTIPARRPNSSDAPDGHTELVVLTYRNALDKLLKTPRYLNLIPEMSHTNYIIKPVENVLACSQPVIFDPALCT